QPDRVDGDPAMAGWRDPHRPARAATSVAVPGAVRAAVKALRPPDAERALRPVRGRNQRPRWRWLADRARLHRRLAVRPRCALACGARVAAGAELLLLPHRSGRPAARDRDAAAARRALRVRFRGALSGPSAGGSR